ncbi:MAG: Trm112 family protein [Kineosporiaceae bacterium]
MPEAPAPPLEAWLRGILRCPRCGSELADAAGPDGGLELWCTGAADPGCRLQYRVDGGVPVLLVDEARQP